MPQVSESLPPTWETWIKFLAFDLVWLWPLWPFGKWLCGWKIAFSPFLYLFSISKDKFYVKNNVRYWTQHGHRTPCLHAWLVATLSIASGRFPTPGLAWIPLQAPEELSLSGGNKCQRQQLFISPKHAPSTRDIRADPGTRQSQLHNSQLQQRNEEKEKCSNCEVPEGYYSLDKPGISAICNLEFFLRYKSKAMS